MSVRVDSRPAVSDAAFSAGWRYDTGTDALTDGDLWLPFVGQDAIGAWYRLHPHASELVAPEGDLNPSSLETVEVELPEPVEYPDPTNLGTRPPPELRQRHLHCWLKSERASYPSIAEWMPGTQAWACVSEVLLVSPAEMRRRGWHWGEVAWPSAAIEDDRRPEPGPVADAPVSRVKHDVTLIPVRQLPAWTEWLEVKASHRDGRTEHIMLAGASFTSPESASLWRDISTIGECKTQYAVVWLLGGRPHTGQRPPSGLGWRDPAGQMPKGAGWWQPIEPPDA